MAELERYRRLSHKGDVACLSAFRLNSLYDISRMNNNVQDAAYKEMELQRKAALVTIELNESTKHQNQVLRAPLGQLSEAKMMARKYDVFVSHVEVDKQTLVDSLYGAQYRLYIRIWYDSAEIDWDDGVKGKIQAGLLKCLFGTVILSLEFSATARMPRCCPLFCSNRDRNDEEWVVSLLNNGINLIIRS